MSTKPYEWCMKVVNSYDDINGLVIKRGCSAGDTDILIHTCEVFRAGCTTIDGPNIKSNVCCCNDRDFCNDGAAVLMSIWLVGAANLLVILLMYK